MLTHSRRRALALLIAAGFTAPFIAPARRALAAKDAAADGAAKAVVSDDADTEESDEEASDEVDCYDSKAFGPWKGQASDKSAGASIAELPLLDPKTCDLTMQLQVNTDYDAKVFITGNEGELPEEFLVKPENRLMAKTASGKVVVDETLCGNCTDIYDDQVSIVLPLSTAPLFREEKTVELVIRLAGKKADCRFKVDAVTLREALAWAAERRDALAEERDDGKCTSLEGCFITTACCELIGLPDDCFELRSLRRYRDEVLARQPNGAADIACYYAHAPRVVARISAQKLLSVYARFILPAAIAARLGLNASAYGLYKRMLEELAPDMP